jgi:hypothetical protein
MNPSPLLSESMGRPIISGDAFLEFNAELSSQAARKKEAAS